YGQMVIEFMRSTTKKPLDVHLMILEPGKYAEEFRKAGADHLIVHYEACPNLHRNIQQIKSLGMKAGVAINPHTPVNFLTDILQDVDTVCVMSVNPGYGAQTFIPHTLSKIRELRKLIDNWNLPVLIEVDGGVTVENAKDIVAAGADVLVAGNTVFKSKDPAGTIRQLRDIRITKDL
ncbi:MAG TPA: ribulose-phosphate 3-epimerase, partial [Chitinophagaceae bacterium]